MSTKLIISFVLLFIISFNACSKNIRKNQQKNIKYNYALSGLNLRNQPRQNSKKVVTIPYGSQVQVIEDTKKMVTFDNITSPWLKIKYNNIQGYVFGGYLSQLSAPQRKRSKQISLKHYFVNHFGDRLIYKNLDKNSYELKSTYIIKNFTVREAFLLLRLRGLYSIAGLIDLPFKYKKYIVKSKAIQVSITVKRNILKELESILVVLDHIEASGEHRYYIEKYKDKDVKITLDVGLP